MNFDWTSTIGADPELLDEEAWDAPRRLTRDELYAESGSFRRVDWPEASGDMT